MDLMTGCDCTEKQDQMVQEIVATTANDVGSDDDTECALSFVDAMLSRNSFESWTLQKQTDFPHPGQPNRLVHEYKIQQMRRSIDRLQADQCGLKQVVREARGEQVEAERSFAYRWMQRAAKWKAAMRRQP